jgi:hypothetical protein
MRRRQRHEGICPLGKLKKENNGYCGGAMATVARAWGGESVPLWLLWRSHLGVFGVQMAP